MSATRARSTGAFRAVPAALVCALLVGGAPRGAEAQTADELTAARALFAEGLREEDARRYEVALEKFRRVQAVRDTVPVRYRIGMCEEALGHLARAYASYLAAVELAHGERGQDDVARAARLRAEALARRVPRLSLAVAGRALAEVEVRIDEREVPAAALRESIPVDPGEHVVSASAVGSKPFRALVSVPEAGQATLTIALEPSASARPPAVAPEVSGAPVERRAPAEDAPAPDGSLRTWGLVAMVGGGVLVGTGAAFLGVRAAAIGDIETMCPGGVCPLAQRPAVESARDRASLLGPLGVGLGAAGLLAAGAGLWLYLRAPATRSGAGVVVVPLATAGAGGAALHGRF